MWGYPMMRGGYGGGWGLGWGLVGLGSTVLFWLVLLWVLAKIFRYSGHREDGDTALKVLLERYARGEIDKKQFEEMKKDLG